MLRNFVVPSTATASGLLRDGCRGGLVRRIRGLWRHGGLRRGVKRLGVGVLWLMLGLLLRGRKRDGGDVARGRVVVLLLERNGVIGNGVVVGVGDDLAGWGVVAVVLSVKGGQHLAVQSGGTVAVHGYRVDGQGDDEEGAIIWSVISMGKQAREKLSICRFSSR